MLGRTYIMDMYARTYGVVWIPHHQHVHQMTERMILQHSWITDDADVSQAFFHCPKKKWQSAMTQLAAPDRDVRLGQ